MANVIEALFGAKKASKQSPVLAEAERNNVASQEALQKALRELGGMSDLSEALGAKGATNGRGIKSS